MIYEVEVSEQADSDLRGIFEYIAFELQSPENASGQLDRLEEQILSLDTMPERYRKYEKEPWKSRGLRVLPVDNYVVLYIPDSDKKVVTILRVMYAGRDIDNQLNLYTKQSSLFLLNIQTWYFARFFWNFFSSFHPDFFILTIIYLKIKSVSY